MDKNTANTQASSDFNKARTKALFNSIISILRPEKRELLSFYDVKKLIKTGSESYKGMQTVKIEDIAGSEGRYSDFNKAFLPKKEHLRKRWESIDKAHMNDVILPPIQLYKIGDMYFVRDGNHPRLGGQGPGGLVHRRGSDRTDHRYGGQKGHGHARSQTYGHCL